MAKGGRYLNTNRTSQTNKTSQTGKVGKKEKKKGKSLKVLVIVLLVLALLLAGFWFAFRTFMGSMLGNVHRAEVVEQNEDKSYDDLMAEIYGNMDESDLVPVTGSTEG